MNNIKDEEKMNNANIQNVEKGIPPDCCSLEMEFEYIHKDGTKGDIVLLNDKRRDKNGKITRKHNNGWLNVQFNELTIIGLYGWLNANVVGYKKYEPLYIGKCTCGNIDIFRHDYIVDKRRYKSCKSCSNKCKAHYNPKSLVSQRHKQWLDKSGRKTALRKSGSKNKKCNNSISKLSKQLLSSKW